MTINVQNRQFSVDCRGQAVDVAIEPYATEGGAEIYKCVVTAKGKISPTKPVLIELAVPQIAVFTTWRPNDIRAEGVLPIWKANKVDSRTAFNMPLVSLIAADDGNGCTVALADCKTPCRLSSGYCEQANGACVRIELFTSFVAPFERYETLIYIDMSAVPAYKSIMGVRKWWSGIYNDRNVALPKAATMPIYAPWYVFHQDFTSEKIYEQCKRGREFGLNTVIIDDGWQTETCTLDYSYCGDWNVCDKKMGDFHKLVKDLHDIGVKTMLWFAVPFIGKYASSVDRFKSMYLRYDDGLKAYVLDPRFKAVREYLVGVYVDFMKKYDLDGFKLDFIDSFTLEEVVTTDFTGMDIRSVDEAVDVLLRDITTALTAIKKDALIEFRQFYSGAVMQQYCNMLRVGDCPGDIAANRIGSIGLRLISDGVAVHADPIVFGGLNPTEAVAYQINHALFAVPQISVDLVNIPLDQAKMLVHYLNYQVENRDVLLFGTFEPHGFAQGYTYVKASDDDKQIIAVYSDAAIEFDCATDFDIVNGSASDRIIIDAKQSAVYGVTAYDCMGNIVGVTHKVALEKGVNEVSVPVSGILVCKKH